MSDVKQNLDDDGIDPFNGEFNRDWEWYSPCLDLVGRWGRSATGPDPVEFIGVQPNEPEGCVCIDFSVGPYVHSVELPAAVAFTLGRYIGMAAELACPGLLAKEAKSAIEAMGGEL
jgi:hypothetical protein